MKNSFKHIDWMLKSYFFMIIVLELVCALVFSLIWTCFWPFMPMYGAAEWVISVIYLLPFDFLVAVVLIGWDRRRKDRVLSPLSIILVLLPSPIAGTFIWTKYSAQPLAPAEVMPFLNNMADQYFITLGLVIIAINILIFVSIIRDFLKFSDRMKQEMLEEEARKAAERKALKEAAKAAAAEKKANEK